MNNILDIKNYNPSSTDCFFFDNNVWIFLYCPIGNISLSKQKDYSIFLQKIQTCRASIFINSMVMSEFANTCLRLDFNLWREETRNHTAEYKKDYLKTSRSKGTISAVIAAAKNILKITERSSDNFNAISLNNVFAHFEDIDFNDSYYIEFCKTMSLILVTDDNDFTLKDPVLKIIRRI
ncbi:hypothetical protein [Butyricimonas muris]|uniref:hypothetical protein n=1 Tax=Butyricimonas muris TaxID=3378067 RepID=UPI0039673F67